jgi:hypothetical protein
VTMPGRSTCAKSTNKSMQRHHNPARKAKYVPGRSTAQDTCQTDASPTRMNSASSLCRWSNLAYTSAWVTGCCCKRILVTFTQHPMSRLSADMKQPQVPVPAPR